MEMTVGEFADRISIQLHKVEKIGEESYPEFVHLVEELLLKTPVEGFEEVIKSIRELYRVNGEIWKLESSLRQGKEESLGLEEIGKRAISIRNWNNKRIAEQNRLIEICGGFKNIKKDHLSEDMDIK